MVVVVAGAAGAARITSSHCRTFSIPCKEAEEAELCLWTRCYVFLLGQGRLVADLVCVFCVKMRIRDSNNDSYLDIMFFESETTYSGAAAVVQQSQFKSFGRSLRGLIVICVRTCVMRCGRSKYALIRCFIVVYAAFQVKPT